MAHHIFSNIDRIGRVVGGLDTYVAARLELGISPWTRFRGTVLTGSYRCVGTSMTIDARSAYFGASQIELFQLRESNPSPYHGAKGPDHVGWVVGDLVGLVAAAQAEELIPVFTAGNAAVRVADLENSAERGSYLELIEGAGMREMIDGGIADASLWDGSDAITEISVWEA